MAVGPARRGVPMDRAAVVKLIQAGVEVLTIPQIVDTFSVSRRAVYNWINAGKVQFFRVPGGSIRIPLSALVGGQPRKAPARKERG